MVVYLDEVKFETRLKRRNLANPLPERANPVPYCIVGDDAFPINYYLLKPYPSRQLDITKRVFNYRLSRARRIVEDVFGILTHRFGVFQKPISLEPEKVVSVVLVACALHNCLKTNCANVYTPDGNFDTDNPESDNAFNREWRQISVNDNMLSLAQQGSNRPSCSAVDIINEFCDYFNTNGQVDWQWDMI